MSDIRWWDEESGERVYVHNARNAEELQEAESRIRELATEHATTDSAVFGGNSTDDDGARLLLDAGYTQVFSLVFMENADISRLPSGTMPREFVTREATLHDLRTLWELNNVAYAGRGYVPVASDEGFERFSGVADHLSLCTVAETEDKIVGFVSSEIHGDCGEVIDVTVHPEYQRRGVASGLLLLNLALIRDRGVKRARLHTNGENISGARSLYSKFGFKVVETHLRFRKPL